VQEEPDQGLAAAGVDARVRGEVVREAGEHRGHPVVDVVLGNPQASRVRPHLARIPAQADRERRVAGQRLSQTPEERVGVVRMADEIPPARREPEGRKDPVQAAFDFLCVFRLVLDHPLQVLWNHARVLGHRFLVGLDRPPERLQVVQGILADQIQGEAQADERVDVTRHGLRANRGHAAGAPGLPDGVRHPAVRARPGTRGGDVPQPVVLNRELAGFPLNTGNRVHRVVLPAREWQNVTDLIVQGPYVRRAATFGHSRPPRVCTVCLVSPNGGNGCERIHRKLVAESPRPVPAA